MFEAGEASPDKLRELLLQCESRRDILTAPAWKRYIHSVVTKKALEMAGGTAPQPDGDAPPVPAGAVVRHTAWGEGQVVAVEVCFPDGPAEAVELPYLQALPEGVSLCADGKTLLHDRLGEGRVSAYKAVFPNVVAELPYPAAFTDGSLRVDA